MKKWLLLLLLIPAIASAGFGVDCITDPEKVDGITEPAKVDGVTSDYGCDGTLTFVGDPGDTETFEYQEDDFCTTEFSIQDNDSIISTYDNAQVKNGTYACSFAFSGAGDEGDTWIEADLGGGDSDYTTDFWARPYAITNNTQFCFTGGFTGSGHSGNYGYRIYLRGGSGDTFEIVVNGVTSALNTYPANAWHRFEVDFNQNGASSVKIYNAADALQETVAFTAADHAPQYISFGGIYDEAAAAGTVYLDDTRYKSSGGGM